MPSSGLNTILYSFPTRRSSDLEDRIYHLSLLFNCAIDYEHALICDLIQSDWALMAPGIERSNLAKRILPSLSGNLKALVSMSLPRSEEHTSELQSPCNLVCRLLASTPFSTLSLHDALPIWRIGYIIFHYYSIARLIMNML